MGGKTEVQTAPCKVFSYSIHRPGIPQTPVLHQPAGMLPHALCIFGPSGEEGSLQPGLPWSGKWLLIGIAHPDTLRYRDRLWGQSLNYHPHIHMLVPAGGPDPDHMEWVAANKKFFVPVKTLSGIFRGVFMEKLRKALTEKVLRLPENQKELFADGKLLNKAAYEKIWHIHIKKTFRGAGQVLAYLGRYTHRVAISNSRILSTDGKTVKFRWKDYRDGRQKTMELDCHEFIRRFMHHILPKGFYKIRYYGILASANSNTVMEECFRLLSSIRMLSSYDGLSTFEILEEILGEGFFGCRACQTGKMVFGLPEGKGKEP